MSGYRLVILEAVNNELNDIVAYYEEKQIGLGHDFYFSLDETLRQIRRSPLAFQLRFNNNRSIRLKKFPYIILFTIEGKTVIIDHIFHEKRKLARRKRRKK